MKNENQLKMNKKVRIKKLEECIDKIAEIQELYMGAYPAWVLSRAAFGHIKALHHLELETNFDDETLGVIKNENL